VLSSEIKLENEILKYMESQSPLVSPITMEKIGLKIKQK
jgi:hypothetical protein